MFDRDMVKRADDRSLQETPYALHGLGMGVATYPFLGLVVDRLMDGIVVTNARFPESQEVQPQPEKQCPRDVKPNPIVELPRKLRIEEAK
mgnify:CR=1 FL=1